METSTTYSTFASVRITCEPAKKKQIICKITMSMYVAVKDIGPLDREKAIRVKCVRCYEIYEKGSTEIKSQELLFCDAEGSFIHLNLQSNDVKKYNNVFQEGKLLNSKTQVKAIKSKGFPTKMFQLKSFDSLKDPTQVNDKVLFDLIGRVVEIHAPVDKIIGGRPAKLLDFKMADNEGNFLQCTVWDSHVGAMLPYYDSGLKEPLILVLQLCRAKVVNGEVRITSCYDATQLHFNASFQEFADFRSQLNAATSPLRSISTATVLSQSTCIDDFTSGALTVTTVTELLKKTKVLLDGCTYLACPRDVTGNFLMMGLILNVQVVIRNTNRVWPGIV
ncbi:PREDICTED: uncharacterized protein LOC109192138 [Ipomoea nil]|uniref:uncharacterized protein LOC109192138 n=1 Tax=Ipomoea nil TaxID=35883 RepID=UPI00090188AA|nr:PREDICTED: uncharacterized protein LOC109192138 [Ipomoea nil]